MPTPPEPDEPPPPVYEGEVRTDPGAHPNMTTAMEFDETLEASANGTS